MFTNFFEKTSKKQQLNSGRIPLQGFVAFNEKDLATVLGGGEDVKSFLPDFITSSFPHEAQPNIFDLNG